MAEGDQVNDDFRQICFTWPSVYATEQYEGRTVLRCLVCDEIKDDINDLRDALRHQDDGYHRDQADKLVTIFIILTFVFILNVVTYNKNNMIHFCKYSKLKFILLSHSHIYSISKAQ